MKEVERNNQSIMDGQEMGGTAIQEVITRAVQDEEFKSLLVNDPDIALKDYELSEIQLMLIKSLDEEDFDKLTAENMEEFFAADSAVYTPDIDAQLEIEEATEDDI